MLAQALVDLTARSLIRLPNQPWRIGTEIQRHSSIRAAERTATRPDHLAHRDQLVEQLWPVVSHPHRQHVPLQHRGGDGATLELEDDHGKPIQSARLKAEAVPRWKQ